MARKSLKEIAESDRQVARFLERADSSDLVEVDDEEAQGTSKGNSTRLSYAQNHLPKGRNISKEAQAAITACILE